MVRFIAVDDNGKITGSIAKPAIESVAKPLAEGAVAERAWDRGVLVDGTDLNGARQQGIYTVPTAASAATMPNIPESRPGILTVASNTGASVTVQKFESNRGSASAPGRFIRTTLTTGPTAWTPWTDLNMLGSSTVVSDSAFVGATGRVYAVVAGVMRNPGTGWAALDDSIHRHANVESTTTGPDSITVNFPTLGAKKVVSFVCTPDETLTKAGYACAASVSLTTAEITVARYTPMADYVQYNATNGWTSFNGVFRNLTFSNGTLTMEHDPIGGSNFMDFQVTSRGDVLASGSMQVGGSTQTVTKIDFRDYTGALITEPSPSMRAYVSRGSSGPVDPSTLTTTRYRASNIWFQGIFEI